VFHAVYALSGSPLKSNAFPISLVHFSRKPWKPSSQAVQPLVWALFQSHRTRSSEVQMLGNFYSARDIHLPPCAPRTQSEPWGLHHLIWLFRRTVWSTPFLLMDDSSVPQNVQRVHIPWLRSYKSLLMLCYATSLLFEVLTT
jgi:hypothetical protein